MKVICLMGPTASGKTDLSLRLIEDLSGEIVSVDSAMVYRMLDIGTAKPSASQRAKVKHHLIDICDPWEIYSAAKFTDNAIAAIHAIHAKNKIPLLVGGTMLYFKALQQGLSPLPASNELVREQLAKEAEQIGWQEMHRKLTEIDPESAARISPSDPQRIQRALEVFALTHQPMSSLWKQKGQELPFEWINIAIAPEDRALLHAKISERFHQMLNMGLIEEVKQLQQCKNLHLNLPSIRSVGYRQVWQYLNGDLNHPEMCEQSIAATRQLAKRQLTWLRHWGGMSWFESSDSQIYPKLLHLIRTSLGLS